MIEFTKMNGLGNDFIVIDATHKKMSIRPEQIQALSDRKTGIGFDQLLLLTASNTPGIDFGYHIFNADGYEVAQCGNGARCIATFIHEKGLSSKTKLCVATKNRPLTLQINTDGSVTVDMGPPIWTPAALPFKTPQRSTHYTRQVNDQPIVFQAVSMGNPHAVITVENLKDAPLAALGDALGKHPDFPEGVNVSIMDITDRHHLNLRTYERGAGETLACGSAACAATVCAQAAGHVDATVTVSMPGGALTLTHPSQTGTILMTGPAVMEYDGKWALTH